MTPDNPYGPLDEAGPGTIACPYCSEPDFDDIGLKSHLLNDCEVFRETPTLPRVFAVVADNGREPHA